MRSILYNGEVVDLLVAVDVVHDASQIFLAGVGIHSPFHLADEGLRNRLVTSADSFLLNAHVLVTNVLVVAEESQALRKHNNRISLDDVSQCSLVGQAVEVLSIVLVSHSGGAVVDNFNLTEDSRVSDVDVGDNRESSTETDTGDVDFLEPGLFLDFLEISQDIVYDGIPHLLVGLLNFTVVTDVAVDHLIGVKDVLPNIQEGVGVSESQHNEGRINTENAFDIFLVFFNVV